MAINVDDRAGMCCQCSFGLGEKEGGAQERKGQTKNTDLTEFVQFFHFIVFSWLTINKSKQVAMMPFYGGGRVLDLQWKGIFVEVRSGENSANSMPKPPGETFFLCYQPLRADAVIVPGRGNMLFYPPTC